MNDEDFNELFKQLSSGQFSSGSWQDVRTEFDALLGTVGDILRSAWDNSEADTALGRLRDLVSSAIGEWNDTADGTPEAQQARAQLEQLRQSIASAAAQAGDQVRPELLRLLRQANSELRRRSGIDQPAP